MKVAPAPLQTSPGALRKDRNHSQLKESLSLPSSRPNPGRRVFQHISGPRKRSTPMNMCKSYKIDYPLHAVARSIQCVKLRIRTARGFRRDLSSSSCNDCVDQRLPTCSDSHRGESESGWRLGQSITRFHTDGLLIVSCEFTVRCRCSVLIIERASPLGTAARSSLRSIRCFRHITLFSWGPWQSLRSHALSTRLR